MAEVQTATKTVAQSDVFTLEPPAPVMVPTLEQARNPVIPVAPEVKTELDAKVLARVDDFVSRVSAADLQSDEFRNMLDRAFAAGRKEVADASGFINGNPILRQTTFKDFDNSSEAKALREMSTILAKANPKGQDLMGPVKVMGIPMPFGNRLRSYLDDFKPMGARLNELAIVLETEEDNMRKEIAGYDVVEKQLFDLVQRLDRATQYLGLLDQRLDEESTALMQSNPEKAKAMREEVLFYVRGNLSDVSQVKVLAVAGIGQIRQLRHTGRMTLRGTNRVKTLGMTALAIAQTMAIATYQQKKRMELNREVQEVVNQVVATVGDRILDHTKMVTEFESNPVFGIQSLEASIDKTLEAINLFNTFRSSAVDTMKADNQRLVALYDKAKTGMRLEEKPVSGSYGDVLSL